MQRQQHDNLCSCFGYVQRVRNELRNGTVLGAHNMSSCMVASNGHVREVNMHIRRGVAPLDGVSFC